MRSLHYISSKTVFQTAIRDLTGVSLGVKRTIIGPGVVVRNQISCPKPVLKKKEWFPESFVSVINVSSEIMMQKIFLLGQTFKEIVKAERPFPPRGGLRTRSKYTFVLISSSFSF